MKIVCLSDTHNLHSDMAKVPDGDVLIHAGDVTNCGSLDDVEGFNTWLGSLPHRYKVCIAGNHDFCFENNQREARRLLTNAEYLQDGEVSIEGIKIYGSPWQPWFYNWAFNLRRGVALREKWSLIPDDVEVLITHGPPKGILDRTSTGELAGCEELLTRIETLKNLRLHVFGHIHEAYGKSNADGVVMVNASTCNLAYQPINPPVVVEL